MSASNSDFHVVYRSSGFTETTTPRYPLPFSIEAMSIERWRRSR